jgi:hypothetical protein
MVQAMRDKALPALRLPKRLALVLWRFQQRAAQE